MNSNPNSQRPPGHSLMENSAAAPWLPCHLSLSFVYSIWASFQSIQQHFCPNQFVLIFQVRVCKAWQPMDSGGPGILYVPFIQWVFVMRFFHLSRGGEEIELLRHDLPTLSHRLVKIHVCRYWRRSEFNTNDKVEDFLKNGTEMPAAPRIPCTILSNETAPFSAAPARNLWVIFDPLLSFDQHLILGRKPNSESASYSLCLALDRSLPPALSLTIPQP